MSDANNPTNPKDPTVTTLPVPTEETRKAIFDGAEYYAVGDTEQVEYESVGDALCNAIDGWYTHGQSTEDCIRAHSPITVTAYNRMVVSADWLEGQAEALANQFDESFGQEFGDPDGDCDGELDTKKLAVALLPALTAAIDGAHVWCCTPVGKRVYDADEVIEIIANEEPEWFDERAPDRHVDTATGLAVVPREGDA